MFTIDLICIPLLRVADIEIVVVETSKNGS